MFLSLLSLLSVCLSVFFFFNNCINFHNYLSTAVCTPSCLHGTCTSPGVCTCNAGWTGDACSVGNKNIHDYNYHDFALMITLLSIDDETDINECGTDKGGCAQTCINTAGSYHCSCDSGYVLDEDGHTCNGEH